MESCQQKLQSIGIGEEEAVQSLCSVALLEGASPRQLFTQFLVARKVCRSEREEEKGGMGRREG